MTGHYLNPVVPENYTNNGTTASFSASYERELTPKDRLTFIVRHELARYQIPNELVQQHGAYLPNAKNTTGCPSAPPEPSDCVFIPGGQLQTGDNFETLGSVSYQHIFSSDAMGVVRGMARDNSNDFYSNDASWPSLPPSTTTSRRSTSTAASPSIMGGRNGKRESNPMPSFCTKTPNT